MRRVLASYVLALLSKEQALMLPALAAAYEHFYRDDRGATSLRLKLSRYLPLFATAAAYLAFRILGFGGFAPSVSRPELGWYGVVLSAIALTGSYLWKLIWPVHLSAFYVFHESHSLRDPHVLAGLAALLVCLSLFVWLWRSAHEISFAWLWMGATLAPVLNARWLPAGGVRRTLSLSAVGGLLLARRHGPRPRPGAQRPPKLLRRCAACFGAPCRWRWASWRFSMARARFAAIATGAATKCSTSELSTSNLTRNSFAPTSAWSTSIAATRPAPSASGRGRSGPLHPYASTLNDLGLLRTKPEALRRSHRLLRAGHA